jgi:hypothetical protein
LLYLGEDAIVVRSVAVVSAETDAALQIIAASGAYQGNIAAAASKVLNEVKLSRLQQAITEQKSLEGDGYFVAYFEDGSRVRHGFYLSADMLVRAQDRELIELFCSELMIAQENIHLINDAPKQ